MLDDLRIFLTLLITGLALAGLAAWARRLIVRDHGAAESPPGELRHGWFVSVLSVWGSAACAPIFWGFTALVVTTSPDLLFGIVFLAVLGLLAPYGAYCNYKESRRRYRFDEHGVEGPDRRGEWIRIDWQHVRHVGFGSRWEQSNGWGGRLVLQDRDDRELRISLMLIGLGALCDRLREEVPEELWETPFRDIERARKNSALGKAFERVDGVAA